MQFLIPIIGYLLLRLLGRILSHKVSRSIFIVFVIVAILSVVVWNSWENTNSNPFHYARVTEIDYKAVVDDDIFSDGRVYVTQRVTFDIHARSDQQSDTFWELWIPLPETDNVEGVKNWYTVHSVKQILSDGTEIVFDESPKLYWDWEDYLGMGLSQDLGPGKWFHSTGPYNGYDRFECLLFYVDGLYRDKVTFEVEYEMTNAALRYADSSELYLVFAAGGAVIHLDSFNAQILFPNDDTPDEFGWGDFFRNNIMPRDGNYDVYTYGTNAHYLPLAQSDTLNPGYHTFIIDMDKSDLRFRPYNRYLEFALVSHGEDKHIFTQNAMTNYFDGMNMMDETNAAQAEYEALPGRFMIIKLIILALTLVLAAVAVRYALTLDGRMNKKHKFFKPVQDIQFFRDIPADIDSNFAAMLVFCKHKTVAEAIDKDGYAAVMLSLVRKGYVELDRINVAKGWEHRNMKLIMKHKPSAQKFCQSCGFANAPDAAFCSKCGTAIPTPQQPLEPLSEVEELYFSLLLRHTQNTMEIPLQQLENKIKNDYGYTASFVENVNSRVIQKGLSENYFQQKDFNKPYKSLISTCNMFIVFGVTSLLANWITYYTRIDFAFGAFFLLGFALIASSVYMRRQAYKYHLLTQFGEDEYAKWRGLYNFLNSNTLMNERTVVELPLWEKYLIYATEFGISEKVVKALEVRALDLNLNLNSSAVLRNPYYRSTGFYVSSRAFRGATRSAVSSSARAASSSAARAGVGGGG